MISQYLIGLGIGVAGVCSIPTFLGFGFTGISAGSTAAAVQSTIGCVKAGSWFAGMTSLAMKGFFIKGAASGATVAATGAFTSALPDSCKEKVTNIAESTTGVVKSSIVWVKDGSYLPTRDSLGRGWGAVKGVVGWTTNSTCRVVNSILRRSDKIKNKKD